MSRMRGAAPVVGLWLAVATGANASPVEYDYSGVLTSAAAGSGLSAGTPFSGSFTYDPAALVPPAIAVEGSNQYLYGQSENLPGSKPDSSGLDLQAGGQTLYSHQGGLQVSIFEIDSQGQYGTQLSPQTTVTFSNENVDGAPLLATLQLKNPTTSVFHSLAPPPALSLADFPDAQLVVTGNQGTAQAGKVLYAGTITALAANLGAHPVPEPYGAASLCLAAAGWLARRRGRRPAPTSGA